MGHNGVMKKPDAGLVRLSLALVAASAVLYVALYFAMGRLSDIFFYTFLDLAFIPVQVLLVGLFLNGLLVRREKRAILDKLNMVIGAFFSEAGSELLGRLASFDADIEGIRPLLLVEDSWTPRQFDAAAKAVAAAHPSIALDSGDAEALRDFLCEKRAFMLRLLENPNLLEHGRFTDLLWAITHLAEELSFRGELASLPSADAAHLSNDMRRAYVALLREWLEHVRHLKAAYPYLFSLAVRTNPVDPDARVEVKG